MYVPLSATSNLSVIDIPTNAVQQAIIAAGATPYQVAVRGDQSLVYVTNQTSNTVSVIDTATNTAVATIPVGSGPHGIALNLDGTRAYVGNSGGATVSVIDTATNTVTGTIAVGQGPEGVAVSPSGARLYVTVGNGVSVIDTTTNAVVTTIPVGTAPRAITLSPSGSFVYVTNPNANSVSVIDAAANVVIANIGVGNTPEGIAVTPDGTRLYVANTNSNSVSVIDTAINAVVATIPVGSTPPTAPFGVAVSPDGTRVYVTNLVDDSVSVINTNTNSVVTKLAIGDGPSHPGACGSGNALLAAGRTFVAKQSGAIACTGAGGPVFTGGTLRIAAPNITSALPMLLGAQGGTIDTQGNTATFSGAITGSGGLTKAGAGVLVLSGKSSYSGPTNINAGTLRAGAVEAFSPNSAFNVAAGATLDLGNLFQTIGSLAGAGNVNLGAATLIVGADNSSTTFSGFIGGTGGLSKIGTGTLTLTGATSYSGPTTIGQGTLEIGNNNVFGGSGNVIIQAGAALRSSVTGTLINPQNLFFSGAGTSTISAAPGTTLTIVSPVTFEMGNTAQFGSATDTGTIVFATMGSGISLPARILVAGGILRAGTSDLPQLTGVLATTTVAAGATLDFNDFTGGIRNLQGAGRVNIGVNAATILGIGSGNFSGSITGAGALFFLPSSSADTLILSGTNTYTGGTTITAGVLQLGDGGTTGSVLGNIVNNSILAINRSDRFDLANVISGSGAFHQNGSGSTVVPQGVTNTYTGATLVNGGGLIVNGSIASSSLLTVNSNAFVGGIGTVPSTVINNSGTVAPGNSIGTLTVAGDLTMAAASTYQAEVSPPAATDRINVTGFATLGGTVEAIPLIGSFRSQTYTILSSTGGITGTFSNVIVNRTSTPGAGNASLSYDANNVYLHIGPGTITPHILPVLPQLLTVLPPEVIAPLAPRNPTAVALAIDRAVLAGVVPPLEFDALFNFSGQGLITALSQLDGEVATGMQQASFKALDMFLGTMLNPFLHGRGETGGAPVLAFAPPSHLSPASGGGMGGGMAAYAAAMPIKAPPAAPVSFDRRWSVWGSAFGGTSNTDGDTRIGSQDTRTNAYGFAAGVDHRLSPDSIVGFALAGGGTSWSLAGSLGSGNSHMFQAGIYGSHRFAGAAYVSAAAAYTWHDASTERTLTLAGTGPLRADFDANSFGGRIESGYRWLTPFAGITPYGALQVMSIRTPSYLETGSIGAAPFALAYASRTTTATRTELGLWLDRSVLVNPDAALTLRGRLAWAHDFDNDRQISATFQTLPLASFTVFGASPAMDYALLSAAAELRLRSGWSFALKGDTEVAGPTQTFSGSGTLRYAW